MNFKNIHQLFPFSRLLKLVLILAISIQLIVISYNHLSGYYTIDSALYFFMRLIRGTWLSIIGGFIIAYPNLFIIIFLNEKFSWQNNILKRLGIQFCFTVLAAFSASTFITLLAHTIGPYREPLMSVLVNNALIYAVVNIILMTLFEAWIFYDESNKAKQMAANLEKELSQIKFEVLKSQINPHFMFNSLNVLSGLINKDVSKAQQFIDEFSQIYRYVLETIEQPVVPLNKELDFMRSYLFLQQIRYGTALTYSVNISANLLEQVLPPLSLQVVLENAIKHNVVNDTKPLHIEITNEANTLIITNNIQPKMSKANSTGLGLKNLLKRYAMISKFEPSFTVDTKFYIAKLPLINAETHECTNN